MCRLKMSSSKKQRLLSNIALPGTVWLASDIHLGPQAPNTQNAFHAFLDQAAEQADALLLCGDIFDAWVGDDLATEAPPPWLAASLAKLRQTANAIPLWLGRGNRDFLIGPRLAQHLGAHLLPDTLCLQTDAGNILLSHGDEYCTADTGYQRFRRVVRTAWVQRLYLSLSLNRRTRIADCARQRSMASNRRKATEIMDVAPHSVEQALRQTSLAIMVHGHTHRPGKHLVQVDGRACTRYVLPDWDYDHGKPFRGGWLAIDRSGITLQCASQPQP